MPARRPPLPGGRGAADSSVTTAFACGAVRGEAQRDDLVREGGKRFPPEREAARCGRPCAPRRAPGPGFCGSPPPPPRRGRRSTACRPADRLPTIRRGIFPTQPSPPASHFRRAAAVLPRQRPHACRAAPFAPGKPDHSVSSLSEIFSRFTPPYTMAPQVPVSHGQCFLKAGCLPLVPKLFHDDAPLLCVWPAGPGPCGPRQTGRIRPSLALLRGGAARFPHGNRAPVPSRSSKTIVRYGTAAGCVKSLFPGERGFFCGAGNPQTAILPSFSCARLRPCPFCKKRKKFPLPVPFSPENGKWFVEGVRRLDERQAAGAPGNRSGRRHGPCCNRSTASRCAMRQRSASTAQRMCGSACTTPFADFYLHRERFDPEKGSLRAYLTAIAERKAIRRWRGKPPQADGGAALRAGISLSHRMGNARRAPRCCSGLCRNRIGTSFCSGISKDAPSARFPMPSGAEL